MKMRLAMAVLTGAVLAGAVACSGSAGGGNGTPTGSGPPSRTLTSAPVSGGDSSGSGTHPAAAWPTYGRDFARSGVAAGVARPGPLTVSWRAATGGAGCGEALYGG